MFRLWPLILWLIYFILPFDLFPDTFPGIGWSEDFLLLAVGYWLWKKKKERYAPGQSDPFGSGREQTDSGSGYHTGSSHREASQAKDPYNILGLERPATPQEIKRAYRIQASRYHPDKVSHLGEEFQTLAKERFQEIQWAYEELQRNGKAA